MKLSSVVSFDKRWIFDKIQQPTWSAFYMSVFKLPHMLISGSTSTVYFQVLSLEKETFQTILHSITWLVFIHRLVCKMHILWSVKYKLVMWSTQNIGYQLLMYPWPISKNGVNTTFRSEDIDIFCNLQTAV